MRHPPYPPHLRQLPQGEDGSTFFEDRRRFRVEWMREMSDRQDLCQYGLAWAGPCWKPLPCEHQDKVCGCGCGKGATHQCGHAGFLVCGVPICDECSSCKFGHRR